MEEITIRTLTDQKGRRPFKEWLSSLRDKTAVNSIEVRLARLRTGILGDCKHLGEGLWEMRSFRRPGYRVYFARPDASTVLLLCGGTKNSQRPDVAKARELLDEYRAQTGEDYGRLS